MGIIIRPQPGCCRNCDPCTNCDACSDCECCMGGKRANQVSVIVPPMHHGGGFFPPCACEDYAGEYIMNPGSGTADILQYCFPPGTSCWWKNEFDTLCGRSIAHLVIGCGPAAVEAQFSIMPTDCHGGGQYLRWWKVFDVTPAEFDCCFDSFEIPWALFIPGSVQCEPDGLAPVTITGLNCGGCVVPNPCTLDDPHADWHPDFRVTIPPLVQSGGSSCTHCPEMSGEFSMSWQPNPINYRTTFGPFCDSGFGPASGWMLEIASLTCDESNNIHYHFILSPLGTLIGMPSGWDVSSTMPISAFMNLLQTTGLPLTGGDQFGSYCSFTSSPTALIRFA